jgi:hypothetical protein
VQPAGTATAGGAVSIASTTTFTWPSGSSDTVKNVNVSLAPGLLAAPAAVPQTCTSSQLSTFSCPAQSLIGTGTMTLVTNPGASPGPSQIGQVSLFLMPAPAAGDVAGVGAILSAALPASSSNSFTSISGPIDIKTDATGQPYGTISFTGLPSSVNFGTGAVPVQVTSLSLTFNGKAADANGVPNNGSAFIRLPTQCSTDPRISVSVDTVSGSPSSNTGADTFSLGNTCAGLAYSPTLAASGTKDAGDNGVTVVTELTQSATEAATKNATLGIPASELQPNVNAAVSEICPTAAGCTHPVGTATASTPLLSSPLNGTVYLTGSIGAPALTIVFPSPFSLTISGVINIAASTVTFQNEPDVPLTDLKVTLSGGPNALFVTGCSATTATATGSFTGQNGKSAQSNPALPLSGCPASSGGGGGGTTVGKPAISGSVTGLASGKAKVSFKLTAGKNAPKLKSFKVKLAGGLSFIKKGIAKGVSVTGAGKATIKLSGSTLVVTLKTAASSVSVTISSKALKVSNGLRKNAKKHKVRSLKVTVPVTDSAGLTTTLTLTVKNPH